MGALSFFTELFADISCQVEIHPRRCLRNRLAGNRCNLCLKSCPARALNYTEKQLRLAEEKCTSCMRCTAVCPNDALAPRPEILHTLLSDGEEGEGKRVIFTCVRQKQLQATEIAVPCLALFSYEYLLFLAYQRKYSAISFNISNCSGCINEISSLAFQEDLKNLLDKTGTDLPTALMFQRNDQKRQTTSDRRQFLQTVKRRTMRAAGSSPEAKLLPTDTGEETRRAPLKIAFLANTGHYSSSNSSSKGEGAAPFIASLMPRLTIAGNCSPCPRCSGICPTGALKLKKQVNGKKLVFAAEKCSGCALCVNFCKEGALSLSCSC